MHIYEGILSATPAGQYILLAGAGAAAVGTAIGLAKLDYERMPKTAVLTSAFFIVSSIQVPLGAGSSVHLVLGGLMGLVLGWSAFPAVLVGLVLQAAFVPGTGLTTLGLNTVIMALPAVVCHYLFHRAACSGRQPLVFMSGFAAGAFAILLGATISAGALMLSGRHFAMMGLLLLVPQMPIALVEGLVTASVIVLLRKVRPEVLQAAPLAPLVQELPHG